MTTTASALARRLVWDQSSQSERSEWIRGLRPPADSVDVGPILQAVRQGGDEAVRDLTLRFDGAAIDGLWVSADEIGAATESVDPTFLVAIDAAIAAVQRFHADQRDALRSERPIQTLPGVVAWRRWVPLERVGAYIPGGRAPLASSVVMTAVPALLAGVEEVIVASPPTPSGQVASTILAAAQRVGVRRVLRVGGAQAIAALAFGTESVSAVDRIVGAGNAWVAAAKAAVSARVAIDLPAGPSECVVIADAKADPELVALDLLAQAEHGPDSVAVLVTDSPEFLEAVEAWLFRAATNLSTGIRALEAIRALGGAILVPDLDTALLVTEDIAPEHLSLQCADAAELATRVRQVGSIFIGAWSPIAGGDYATGTNHVLPTGGSARAFSGLGVEAFGRWIEIQQLTSTGLLAIADTVDRLADAEGMAGHGRSVRARAERVDQAVDGDNPVWLLRRPQPVEAYAAEPGDEDLAEQFGLDVAEIARLDMNTIPGGEYAEYPDLGYRRLRRALAQASGAPPERIIPGAGGDELIRLVTTQTLTAGDAVVIPTPTFGMFAVEAGLVGARVIEVPRQELNVRQPVEQILSAVEAHSARLVWICSPNNPTGDAFSLDEISALASGLGAIVAIDEVYLEFAEQAQGASPNSLSTASLQEQHSNLLVVRSLSKAYSMAGTRVGYLVVPPGLVERFDAARLPRSVSASSEEIAIAAIADQTTARARRAQALRQRQRLAGEFERLGWEVLTSVTNFLTFRPTDADALADGLEKRGIVLRRYPSGPLQGWLRVSARTEGDTDRLLQAVGELGL